MTQYLFGTLLVLASVQLSASSLKQCRAIEDTTERLSCYDTLADTKAGISESHFGEVKYKEVPEEKVFTVVSAKKSRDKYIITMDDHQIWKQSETSRTFKIAEGDKVVINSGSLSSYFLKKVGGKSRIKVKRVK